MTCGENFSLFITKEGIFGAGNSMRCEMGSQWVSEREAKGPY